MHIERDMTSKTLRRNICGRPQRNLKKMKQAITWNPIDLTRENIRIIFDDLLTGLLRYHLKRMGMDGKGKISILYGNEMESRY